MIKSSTFCKLFIGRAWRREHELVADTGLGVNRVSGAVSRLEALGLVHEDPVQDGQPGRPVVIFSVEPGAGRVMGLDIGGQQSRAVLSDLDGRMLASDHPSYDRDAGSGRHPR